jgi:hypothetical protein
LQEACTHGSPSICMGSEYASLICIWICLH